MAKLIPILAVRFLWLSLLLVVSGCGFQLAGTSPNGTTSFDRIYIDSRVAIQQLIDQPVIDEIESNLAPISTEVLRGTQANMPGLVILNEEQIERSMSATSGLFDRQIEIEKRVQYQLFNEKGDMVLADSIRVSRQLTQNRNNPSAKTQETLLLIDTLNSDISRQLIWQLDSFVGGSQQSDTNSPSSPNAPSS